MECNRIQENLSPYLEGILSPEERRLVEEHLKGCSTCSKSLVHLTKTLNHLQALEEVDPPPWLKTRVMARVQEAAESKKGLLHWLFYPLHVKVPIQAVAAMAVAVTCIYLFKGTEPEIKLAQTPLQEEAPQMLPEEKEKTLAADKRKSPPPSPVRGATPREKKEVSPPGSEKVKEYPEAISAREEKGAPSGSVAEVRKHSDVAIPQEPVAPSIVFGAKDEIRQRAMAPRAGVGVSTAREEEMVSLAIRVKDPEAGIKEIEAVLVQLEGQGIKVESAEGRQSVSAKLGATQLGMLLEKLQPLGEVTVKPKEPYAGEGLVKIVIQVILLDG